MGSNARMVVGLILACLLGVGAAAAAADPGFPTGIRLILVAADSASAAATLTALGVPVYARLVDPAGGWLLAGVDDALLAAITSRGLVVETVDPTPADGTFYRVARRVGRPDPDFAAFGRVLWDDGVQVVIRASPPDAERLAAAGYEIAAIPPRPIQLSPRPTARIPAAVPADPAIAGILDQLSEATLQDCERKLTGLVAVAIGGSPYSILTRHTYSGTPIQKATQYVFEQFQAMGLSTSYHVWSGAGYPNVTATRTGAVQPEVVYLICAHLDDMPNGPTAPGADDNASGSAAVLAAAELLTGEEYYYDTTLLFALWTGEEQGLLGSQEWADWAYNSGMNIQGVINLDMIAYNTTGSAPTLDLHARSALPATVTLAGLFADVVNAYDLELTPDVQIDHFLGDYSDNASFWDYGYTAILAIEDYSDFNPYYHTTADTLATLNMPYFTAFTKASLGTLLHLCGGAHRYGDLDRNGALAAADLAILIQHLNGNLAPGTAPFIAPSAAGDLDRDGAVDAADLVALAHALAHALAGP